MHATVISDQAECDRIWTLADRVFAPYATYRQEAAEGFFGRLSRQSTEDRYLSPASTEIGRARDRIPRRRPEREVGEGCRSTQADRTEPG
jgi:hypothetical protein